MPYPCKTDARLKGWYVVHKVSPRGGVPVPNNEDYKLDPNTYEGDFYQEEGLEGTFVIDLTEDIDGPLVIDVEEDDDVEVQDARDLELLQELGLETDNVDDDGPLELIEELRLDTDDEMDDAPIVDEDEYF